ncbi:MAG: hypothetical protein FWD63_03620 [Propionibacteriaceae bacterium]|nr:hypothetical protein [Propionibacteriaceae bacterium]
MARRAWGLLIMAGLALAGCSAAPASNYPPTSSPSPSPVVTAPPGGVLLTDAGFSHAPTGFSIPAGLTPASSTNLSELVTVVFNAGDGATVYAYLKVNLDGMGCPITAASADSITWKCGVWTGGFTMTPRQAALTLRRMAG